MAPDGKSSNGFPGHAWDTELHDKERKNSCVDKSSRKEKKGLSFRRGTETIKFPDKLKAENHQAMPFIHHHREQRQCIDAGAFHQKAFGFRQGQSLNRKATADDELIKHMSNLPAYLQRINKGDGFQEKVLNVGVLDWTHLEKWNLVQRGDVRRGGTVTLSSNCDYNSSTFMSGSSGLPNAVPIKILTQRKGVRGPLNSLSCSIHADGRSQCLKPADRKVIYPKESASVPKIFLDSDRKILPASNFSGRSTSQFTVDEREKRKESSQETDFNTIKSSAPVKIATEPCRADVQKSDRDRKCISEAGASSFYALARRGEHVNSSNGETRERLEKPQKSDVEVSNRPPNRKQKSAILLPKRFPQSSIPDMLKKNKRDISSDTCLTDPNWSSFSGSLSSGAPHSGAIVSDIPRSSPLPSQVVSQNDTISLTVDQTYIASTPPGNQDSLDPEGRRSRNASPNRRFSFSLGRMTRSFSFKETTSVPQLGPTYISAKSGPVTSQDSTCDILNQDKANSSNKGRSSPLRRLLEPLLKSRSISSHRSAEKVKSEKLAKPTAPRLQEKRGKFTVQALLQLTVRNGNPLFKLVVDNSNDVLVASISNAVSSRKYGSFRSCTFYSVNEVKKKSTSWINLGSKAKEGGFAYNVIGQMKLSNSPFTECTLRSFEQQVITTECVLFSVDSRSADRQPENSIPNGELAAFVFKFSINEQEDPNSVTVILPGGVHGLPNKGEPSPLIDRWISGGSCDCGGWDIGCKLHVLSNKSYLGKSTKASKACPTSDHLQLFSEAEDQSGRMLFSMAPFRKGIYSIEFDSSISLLQAFSICVAFISYQGSPDLPQASCLSGLNAATPEPTPGRSRAPKSPMIFQREGPAKYAPRPPLSPVGRV
ncbi:hypothetical protein SAY86_015375 [Trapa natans]|uniref:DUF3527 domain protein n=1 Tax=Trapa natans TaxID=22666 RepID=A0AAN7KJC9_TRANT|nr:hypothetical protein SAY86_015375 [Trapa natans]